jgi:hypothetical protein
MGCKGPQTKANCPIVRWNRRVSWCVESGAPCAGCAQANPEKAGFNWVDLNTPFLKRFKNLRIGDIVFQPATLAAAVGGIVAIALVAHGFGMKATGRTKGGADFELERAWDQKHPDQAIGAAAAAEEAAKVQGIPVPAEIEVEAEAEAEIAIAEDAQQPSNVDAAPDTENAEAALDAENTEAALDTPEEETPAEGGEE